MEYIDKIIWGNSGEVAKELPDECFQEIFTSSPYFNLRAYEGEPQIWDGEQACEHEWTKAPPFFTKTGKQGSTEFTKNKPLVASMRKPEPGMFCIHCGAFFGFLGLEPTPELYIKHLVDIFREYRRVLRQDGTLFLNIADSYASSPGGYWASGDDFDCDYRKNQRGERQNRNHLAAKPKDLIGIPWMLALALRDDGWWLRSTILWKKRNCMPSSALDRPTTDFEYIFLLAKNGAKPSFWTHRDGYGSRQKPDADYRWFDKKLAAEWDTEPDLDWRMEEYTTPEGPQARRWKRYNLWKGHAYYYNSDAIMESIKYPDAADGTRIFGGKNKHGANIRNPRTTGRAYDTIPDGRNKRTVWTEGETYQNVWNLLQAFQEAGASDEMIEKATTIFGEMLGSDSSIIDIPTKGFSGAHFGVFPPDLAKVIILAGSSDVACPICGAAWFPRKEKVGEFQRRYGTGNAEGSPYTKQSSMQAIWEDKGLQPTCACEGNDGSGASLVGDIFSGAGTTCMVAKQKGRHWLGIEVAQKYVEMSENRISEAELEVDPDKEQLKLKL